MRLGSAFGSTANNFTVDRSGGVQSITGGFVSSSGVSSQQIKGTQGTNTNSNTNTNESTSYTKKVTIPNGGIKLKLTNEPPQGDIEVNGVSGQSTTTKQQSNITKKTNNNSGGFGVQTNYGVTNTQTDRLKNEGFEDNFKTYSFGGIVFDSSVKR